MKRGPPQTIAIAIRDDTVINKGPSCWSGRETLSRNTRLPVSETLIDCPINHRQRVHLSRWRQCAHRRAFPTVLRQSRSEPARSLCRIAGRLDVRARARVATRTRCLSRRVNVNSKAVVRKHFRSYLWLTEINRRTNYVALADVGANTHRCCRLIFFLSHVCVGNPYFRDPNRFFYKR